MTRKAKPKKHTAKEIQAKVDATTTNKGGGKAVIVDRTSQGKGGHAKFECPHCKVTAPDAVRYKDLLDNTYADLSNLLKSCSDVCAIIYCLECTTCDDLSSHLSQNGISCAGI